MVLLEQVGRNFNQGDYERAYHKLLSLPILRAQLNRQVRARFNQLLVRLQTRRGFAADALHLLRQESEASLGDPGTIVEFVNVLRFDGLAPWNDSFWTWIERGQNIQSNDSGPRMRLADLFAFRGHHGFGLGRKGQWEEATDLLQLALEDTAQEENLPRIYARTLADLADIWRMRGEPDRARFILMEVEELQVRHQCNGDMAEFTLANKAKLSTDTHRAMEWLAHARSIQTELNHRPGLARTLLLEARLDPKRSNQTERLEQIQALSATIPSLRHCPLVRKVLDQWNAWTSGSMIAGEKDYYWGL